jgi:DNA-binding MarR family transcriptional regulator
MTDLKLDHAVTDFTHAIGLIVRRVRVEAAPNDLSLTESLVMARLAKDGPATTASLARAEGMRPQSMGTTLAALESLGIVEREPHPTDGRQVLVALTAKGAALRRTAKDAKRAWLVQAIARLAPEERKTLLAAGEILKRLAGS